MAIPFRFIHCGDLHLGAPFQRLQKVHKKVAKELIKATYASFQHVVELAIQERVQALLISGDIYDSEQHNMEAQVRFVRELEKATAKGIEVFVVFGNHDPMEEWRTKVAFPKGVHVFSADRVERKVLRISGEEVAAIYGISHRTKGITEDLAARFKAESQDVYAIGLLHATVGAYEGSAYAPTTMDVVREAGMDYWALGHIHKQTILSTSPYVVYPGNTQGLSSKEIGPKGCYLVSVGANGHTEVSFRAVEEVRWEEAIIDITELTQLSDLSEMIRHKKKWASSKVRHSLLLKLILVGEGPLAKACSDVGTRELWLTETQEDIQGQHGFVYVYAIENRTNATINLTERRALPDLVGDYLAAYDTCVAQGVGEARQILENRQELKNLKGYQYLLSDALIDRAIKRAEIEGVRRILGDQYEN